MWTMGRPRHSCFLFLLLIFHSSNASAESAALEGRGKVTPPPGPALSFHDLAALSRGDKPSVIERTIGAIFSKVALGSPAKVQDHSFEEIEKTTTTTEKPKETASNNVLPKLVTPKIGFDLDKWGFAGFKPREDPFQESSVVTEIEVIKETTAKEFPTVVTEVPTSIPDLIDKQQIRINVPKEAEFPETTPSPNKTYPDLVTDEIPLKPIITNVPLPTWADDNIQRELAWRVHIYGTTALYLLVAIYAVTSLVQLAASMSLRLLPRVANAMILAFVTLVPVLRAAHLLHDPYASDRLLHPATALVLFDLAFPCLSSAHVVLLLSMLKVADLEVLPRKMQHLRTSVVIILLHFILTVSVDIAAGYTTIGSLHLASQAAFVLWTLTLCLGYFAAFGPVSRAARGIQIEMRRAMSVSLHISSPKVPQRLPRPTLLLTARITLGASVSCLFVAALQLYGMFGTFGIPWKNHESIMTANHFWSWWTFQLIARLVEITACFIMAIVASMPQCITSKSKLGAAAQAVGCCIRQKGDITTMSVDLSSTKTLTLADGQYPVCGNSHQLKNYCYQQKPNEAYSAMSIKGDALIGLTAQIPQLKRITLSSENGAFSKSRPSSVLYNDGGFSRVRDLYDQADKPSYETIDEIRGERTVYAVQTGRLLNECRSCEPTYNCLPTGNYGYPCQNTLGAQETCPRNSHEKALMENYVKLLLASRGENRSQDTLTPEEVNPCVYNPQCPASTCSSESAANSFDMRLYGCPCPMYNHYHPLPKNGDAGLRPSLRRSPVFRPCCEGTLPLRKSKRGAASPARDLKVLETAERIRQTRSDTKCDSGRKCGNETVIAVVSRVKQPDASPDSAIVADYESKRQQTVCSPFHEGILQTALEQISDKRTFASSVSNFLKLSSSFSLNDIFKSEDRSENETNRKTFLGRLRGSQGSLSSNNYRYSPLQAGDENYSDSGDILRRSGGLLTRDNNSASNLNLTNETIDSLVDSRTPCWLSPGVLRKHADRLSRIEGFEEDNCRPDLSDLSVNAPSESNDGLSDLSRLNGDSSEVESIV